MATLHSSNMEQNFSDPRGTKAENAKFCGLQEIATELLGETISNELFRPLHYLESPMADWCPELRCSFCGSQSACTAASLSSITEQENTEASPSTLNIPTLPVDVTTEPLDLSAPGTKEVESVVTTPVRLKVPLVHSKSGCLSVRRRYTPDELTAAVTDICSGRLGTRKAATLYGIPRSTLRNKIFRMHTELSPSRSRGDQGGWQRRLEQLRRKHDLGAGTARPFGKPPLLDDKRRTFTESARLSEIVQRLTQTKLPAESQLGEVACGLEEPPRLEGDWLSEQPDMLRSLRIPQFHTSESVPENAPADGAVGMPAESLKVMIAKTITEKLRTRCIAPAVSEVAVQQPIVVTPVVEVAIHRPPVTVAPKKCKPTTPKISAPPPTRASDGKRVRPKRGRYRRYNNAILLEAVRCVQRGEMSVHRAGSHYGVPHSTLEYKVKERHLLRKARTNRTASQVNGNDFPLETPASDLLKELQRKATENATSATTGEECTSQLTVK